MKIVEIILDLRRRAGAEVFFSNLCKELSKDKEIELSIISLWDDVDESFYELKNIKNVTFYSLSKRKGFDFKAARKLKKILKKINPDIIHTHRSILLTYFLAFGFFKRKWKIVHTIHNIPTKEANKITWFLRKQYDKKRMIYYVGISDLITNEFKNISNGDISTIYNGIDFPKNSEIKNISKTYDFINVARFSEQKNHKLLFDAFNSFYEKHTEAKLLCVGSGELEENLKKYVSGLSCSKNVTFYGSTDDVYSLLNQSKIFILSSLYEGTPVSILEAMAVGLPIIAPKVGGIPDIIKHDNGGLLFEVQNKVEMVESMEELYTNKMKCEFFSNANIETVRKFSIHNCANEYTLLFKRLIEDEKTKKEKH